MGSAGRGSPTVDRIEAAVPVVVEAALDGGPGQAGQADEIGPGQPVGGQAEEFHPPLHLGARVVVPVVRDLVETSGVKSSRRMAS